MAFTSRGAHGTSRTQTALADINITPLVDVVLVLLLIFMLTAPVLQSGIDVAIPHTRSTSTLTEERMVVTIDKDQNVFLQSNGADKPIRLADLPALLTAPPPSRPKPNLKSPQKKPSTSAPTNACPSEPSPRSWKPSNNPAFPTSASSPNPTRSRTNR